MKAVLHFPTEQYGFAEVEVEVESPDEAIILYKKSQIGEGLTDKEFNDFVDQTLATGNVVNGTELYEKMNEAQRWWTQTTKRSIKRVKYDIKKYDKQHGVGGQA